MRYKFLKWLKKKIFKTQECEIAPKIVKFIYYLIFPFNWLYERQSQIKYDPLTDIYTIKGMKFSGKLFETLRNSANIGEKFQLLNTNGNVCTVKRLKEKF